MSKRTGVLPTITLTAFIKYKLISQGDSAPPGNQQFSIYISRLVLYNAKVTLDGPRMHC